MKDVKNDLSRRTILAGMGVGAGAMGLAGISSARAAVLPEPANRDEFDVVVIGSGIAGCAAALEAASAGARVAVIEKASERLAGGNSLLAGGIFAMPRADTDTARKELVEDFIRKALGRGNHEVYALIAANARGDVAWLKTMGIEFLPEGEMPPYRIATATAAPGPYMGMPRTLKTLRDRIAEMGGTFHFETKARQLVMNERGAVSGVRAVGPSGVVQHDAKSVVIASGGYAGNTALLETYASPNAGAMMVRGIRWATGDGLLMAQEAGAGLAGMGGLMSLHIAAVDPVETAAGNPFALLPHAIAVNRDGKRFIDESKGYVAHGKAVLDQPLQTSTLIADERIREMAGPASSFASFERLGIRIIEADSLGDLAAQIEVPADALETTVAEFNAAVADGGAPGANPPKATLAYRIEGPRYYAFHPLRPGITLSFGGIMINADARALEADGRIIPGLFAAGEGAGGVFHDDYVGGASLANCLVMGRIAGRNAAA